VDGCYSVSRKSRKKKNRRHHQAKKRQLGQQEKREAEALAVQEEQKQLPELSSINEVKQYLSQDGTLSLEQIERIYKRVADIAAEGLDPKDNIAAFKALLAHVKLSADLRQKNLPKEPSGVAPSTVINGDVVINAEPESDAERTSVFAIAESIGLSISVDGDGESAGDVIDADSVTPVARGRK